MSDSKYEVNDMIRDLYNIHDEYIDKFGENVYLINNIFDEVMEKVYKYASQSNT